MALTQRTAEKKNAIAAVNLVSKDFVLVIFNTPCLYLLYYEISKVIQVLGMISLKFDEIGIPAAI